MRSPTRPNVRRAHNPALLNPHGATAPVRRASPCDLPQTRAQPVGSRCHTQSAECIPARSSSPPQCYGAAFGNIYPKEQTLGPTSLPSTALLRLMAAVKLTCVDTGHWIARGRTRPIYTRLLCPRLRRMNERPRDPESGYLGHRRRKVGGPTASLCLAGTRLALSLLSPPAEWTRTMRIMAPWPQSRVRISGMGQVRRADGSYLERELAPKPPSQSISAEKDSTSAVVPNSEAESPAPGLRP